MNSKYNDPKLDELATPRQLQYLQATRKHGSMRAAARHLGLSKNSVSNALTRLEQRAALQGYAPDTGNVRPVPPGFALSKVTTLARPNGEVVAEWTQKKPIKMEWLSVIKEAMEEIVELGAGRLKPMKAPKTIDADLLAVYQWGDLHFGLMAWARETGADFDIQIAERTMRETFDRVIASTPPAKRALLIVQGDYYHTDGSANATTRGTPQDVDSRWPKIAKRGFDLMCAVIDRLLQKHKQVDVWVLPGNHDADAAVMLSIAVEALYRKDKRAVVELDPQPFRKLVFGKNLIAATHGHHCKPENLPGIMATDWPKEWGETLFRLWFVGHLHQEGLKEESGCSIITCRSSGGKSAWEHASGYRSGRDIKCHVIHKERGPVLTIKQRVVG